jgi:hypothetical protein
MGRVEVTSGSVAPEWKGAAMTGFVPAASVATSSLGAVATPDLTAGGRHRPDPAHMAAARSHPEADAAALPF